MVSIFIVPHIPLFIVVVVVDAAVVVIVVVFPVGVKVIDVFGGGAGGGTGPPWSSRLILIRAKKPFHST